MMTHNVEREFKTLVTSFEFNRLRDLYADSYVRILQKNYYYCDIAKQILNLKAILRRRVTDDSNFLTFKIRQAGQLHEFEKDNVELDDAELLALMATYDIHPPFVFIAQAETDRYLVDLPTAQLCMDYTFYGYIDGRSGGIYDREIEYELKGNQDSRKALTEFKSILKRADILYEPNTISKFQRALTANAPNI